MSRILDDEHTDTARAAACLGDEFAGKLVRDPLAEIERALKCDEDVEHRQRMTREYLDLTNTRAA